MVSLWCPGMPNLGSSNDRITVSTLFLVNVLVSIVTSGTMEDTIDPVPDFGATETLQCIQ